MNRISNLDRYIKLVRQADKKLMQILKYFVDSLLVQVNGQCSTDAYKL